MASMITKTITGENQYSDSIALKGLFNLSLSGTWSATVTVQRSFDNGTTWMDIGTFTSNCQKTGFGSENDVLYRFGVKLGDYTSGSVVGMLSQ